MAERLAVIVSDITNGRLVLENPVPFLEILTLALCVVIDGMVNHSGIGEL